MGGSPCAVALEHSCEGAAIAQSKLGVFDPTDLCSLISPVPRIAYWYIVG